MNLNRPSEKIDWLFGNENPESIRKPDEAIRLAGVAANQPFTASTYNWKFNNISQWQRYLESSSPDIVVSESLAEAIASLPEARTGRAWLWVEDMTDSESVVITTPNLLIDFSPRFYKAYTSSPPSPVIRVSATGIVIRNGIFTFPEGVSSLAFESTQPDTVVINTVLFRGTLTNIPLNTVIQGG